MNPIKAWNRFLFAPISARPLGLFRIAFGVLMMIYLVVMTVEFDHWYTDRGLLQGLESGEAAGPLRFSPLHYVHDPITPRVLYADHVRRGPGRDPRLAHAAHERGPLAGHALVLPPQSLVERRARCRAGHPLLLHDALPGRGGVFDRRPSARRSGAGRPPSR